MTVTFDYLYNTVVRTILTDARATLAVQVAQATETFFATRTVGQVAFARLRDHTLGHDGRAHGLVARVADVRERQQRTDDSDEENVVFHFANTSSLSRSHMRFEKHVNNNNINK